MSFAEFRWRMLLDSRHQMLSQVLLRSNSTRQKQKRTNSGQSDSESTTPDSVHVTVITASVHFPPEGDALPLSALSK